MKKFLSVILCLSLATSILAGTTVLAKEDVVVGTQPTDGMGFGRGRGMR